ncbi:hypothetical protein PaeBR_15765 [Paenibacillus sp. BR2-3]|uniref:hypothetical protein n=1 Tax=Paenibacillus sp. BR2-3 TaxID=3048494 RepID=UPI003977B2F9
MEATQRSLAEQTLKYLCVGSQVEGIRFYGIQVQFSESEANRQIIDGQIYLNIESRFKVFDCFPEHIPTSVDDLPELEWIEASKIICELRLKQIIDIH